MPAGFRRRHHAYREVVAAGRPSDGWWVPVLVEPVAFRLVRLLADHTPTTPNQLTALSAMLTVAAAGGLLEGGPVGLIAGALLVQLSLLADCMDGTLARLTGTATELGAWFGAVAGRGRLMLCGAALLLGEYARTTDRAYLFLTALVFLCAAVLEIAGGHGELFPSGFARRPPAGRTRRRRFARAARTSRARPLTWPVTEAEYGLAVCVLAPLTGAYTAVIAVASGLLLCGELAGLGAAVRSSRRARPARRLPAALRPYDAADRTSHG